MRSGVRFLDAWEDGRWVWRSRPEGEGKVDLALGLLRRTTGALMLLVVLCSIVASQLEGPAHYHWNGAMQAYLFLAVPTGAGWLGTEWLLRAQAGAMEREGGNHG